MFWHHAALALGKLTRVTSGVNLAPSEVMMSRRQSARSTYRRVAASRFLLNAVAADGTRFSDLQERFTFVGANEPDPVSLEDWKGRGITPIPYNAANGHSALLHTLERWAALSASNGKTSLIDAEVKRIIRTNRGAATEADRDLFDHLMRRSDSNERVRLSALASKRKAALSWLDAIVEISTETDRERR